VIAIAVGVYIVMFAVVVAVFCAASKAQPSFPNLSGHPRLTRDKDTS
jgi:hypothetical protein